MMKQTPEQILKLRDKVLELLNGKTGDFFLGGGTALSLYYLHHRESFDLDFFTKVFSRDRIKAIISEIENSLNVKTISKEETISKDVVQILRYYIPINDKGGSSQDYDKNSLKIDFIEDVYFDVTSNNVVIGGIPILSQENIYLRKIYAVCGALKEKDGVGRVRFAGGRQEAKDLFDLYFLSKDFIRLSDFVAGYCPDEKEKIITWYSTYKREEMKLGITELIVKKKVVFFDIEKHFKVEIKDIIERELQ